MPLHAQVNTETMRRDGMEPGMHHRIAAHLEFHSGNSDFLSTGASYRLDLLEGNLYSFLVASYDRRSSDKELSANEGFTHLRFIYTLDSLFRPEIFAQKEFNEFILLRDRNLIGGGLRLRPLAIRDSSGSFILFVGIGGMYETEQVATTPEERTQLFRSTNYLSLQGRIGTSLHITVTGYYQIAPARTDDFRILTEGEMGIRLTDILSFVVSTRYRRDNLPPAGVKNYDFRVKNGLAVTF
jgi:hypothetical protein